MITNGLVKYILVIVIAIISFDSAYSQLCRDFKNSLACSFNISKGFKEYGQSKSGTLEINKTFEYNLVLYGGRDYIFVVCTEKGYAPVHYRIIETMNKNVLFDNTQDDYIESIGFTMDNTQNIIFEVTILAETVKPEEGLDLRACIGINIFWRKIPKIGF